MKHIASRTLAALALVGVVAACTTEDLIYAGGPAGPAAELQIANANVVMVIGATATVGGQLRDAAGNPLTEGVAFTACDPSILTLTAGTATEAFGTVMNVTASNIAATCIRASGGGLTDSVGVTVGPAGIRIAGPDTVGSGNDGQFTLAAFDASGAALSGAVPYTWLTTNAGRLVTDVSSGLATGRGTGAVSIQARAPGGAAATKAVTVAPGVFGGTLSASTGSGGLLVSAARAATASRWDSDTEVRLGGVLAYVDHQGPDSLFFAVPATGVTGAQTLAFSRIGPDQLAQNGSFTNNSAFGDTYTATNTNAACVTPATSPNSSTIMSRNKNVYFTHGGLGTGSASRGCWNGGAQIDHYFAVTTGATAVTVTITAQWRDGSDVDLYITDLAGNFINGAFSGSSTQEVMTHTFPASSTLYIVASMWSAGSNLTNFKMNLAGL